MSKPPISPRKKRGHRHLTPLEIITITEAVQRNEKVALLAKQFGVTRQTIYNAIQSTQEGRISPSSMDPHQPLTPKRKRSIRIPQEICQQLIAFKQKYFAWGIEYLRTRWIQMGHQPIAKSTIYKIFKENQIDLPKKDESAHYERFEMLRPGQLYQMDIQGRFYLPGIGWLYGFAVIDDYSRFVAAMTYFLDERLSNGILTLNQAITQYGIPEAIYVDNGSQFKSRGERMNNFELFCQAYGIKIIYSTPYRPQGKGKIERFFETLENQFIEELKQKIHDKPGYTLAQINKELTEYLTTQYHARIHGGTHEKPLDRFGQGTLCLPNPAIDVQKFLERTDTRYVNKFHEISFQGYKIQVDLVPGTKVNVVDLLETIRIEVQNQLIREINKTHLIKTPKIDHQDGAFHSNPTSADSPNGISSSAEIMGQKEKGMYGHKPDPEGYFHRRISPTGSFKIHNLSYYLDLRQAGKEILVQISENSLHLFSKDKVRIGTLDRRSGKKY